jgi:hypothetical protein
MEAATRFRSAGLRERLGIVSHASHAVSFPFLPFPETVKEPQHEQQVEDQECGFIDPTADPVKRDSGNEEDNGRQDDPAAQEAFGGDFDEPRQAGKGSVHMAPQITPGRRAGALDFKLTHYPAGVALYFLKYWT